MIAPYQESRLMPPDRVYFPGLNSLRFFAALSVVLVHIEQFKGFFGVTSGHYDDFFILARIGMIGRDAVTLFFVLSGFLITYLLLLEQERAGSIHIGKFYARRFLRIWPLYYLLVFIGFILVPLFVQLTQWDGYYESIRRDFFTKLALYLLFLPNVATVMGYFPVGIDHLWTIGVEEQFYLLWPALLRYFRRRPLVILLGIIVFKIIVTLFRQWYFATYPPNDGLTPLVFILRFLATFQIESMAMGGIVAYLFARKSTLLAVLFNPIVEKIIIVMMLLHVLILPSILLASVTGWLTDILLSGLYALFMLNISANPNATIRLENPFLRQLGNLSYGIYMFHMAIIYFVMIIFDKLGWGLDNGLLYNLMLYAIVVGVTIAVSALSYRYFETRFLQLKENFSVVRSGA